MRREPRRPSIRIDWSQSDLWRLFGTSRCASELEQRLTDAEKGKAKVSVVASDGAGNFVTEQITIKLK